MLYRVEIPFRYSADGISAEWLLSGAEVEIRDDLVGKLKEDGKIVPVAPVEQAIELPAPGIDFTPYLTPSPPTKTLTLPKKSRA